jgi:hypothetical protein
MEIECSVPRFFLESLQVISINPSDVFRSNPAANLVKSSPSY